MKAGVDVVKGGMAHGTQGRCPGRIGLQRSSDSQQCFSCLGVFRSPGDFVKVEVVIQ